MTMSAGNMFVYLLAPEILLLDSHLLHVHNKFMPQHIQCIIKSWLHTMFALKKDAVILSLPPHK